MIGVFVKPHDGDEFLLDVVRSPPAAKKAFGDWYTKVNYSSVSVRYAEVEVKEKKDG